MAPLFAVAFALAGAWEAIGAPPPGHRLVQETVGPDLVRAEWESPGLGRYWIDLTPDRGGSAFCRAGGLVLQVRRSLGDGDESFVLDPPPAPVTQGCDRLGAAGPALLTRMGAEAAVVDPAPPDGPPVDPSAPSPPGPDDPHGRRGAAKLALFRWRPLHLVVLTTAAAALFAVLSAPRRALAAGAALTALALALRLTLARPTALLGGDAAYERLVSALGRGELDRYYGDTWMSALGLVHEARARIAPTAPPVGPTDFVHDVNLLCSALAPALLAGLARRLGLPVAASLGIGAALAAFPQAIALSRVEDHAPMVAFLQLLAAWAALGERRRDAALAVGAAGLLAHLRPDQLPVAGLLLLPLVPRHRFGFVAGLAFVVSRLAYLPHGAHNPIDLGRLLNPRDLVTMARVFVAPWGAPGLLALAVAGAGAAAGAPARRDVGRHRHWLWAALVFAATTAPYLPKSLPFGDPLRFSLPGASWLLLLAGAGLGVLVHTFRRSPRSAGTRIAVAAGGIGLVALLTPSSPAPAYPRPWAWEEEYRFLRDRLPATPGGTGWYDASQDPNGAFGLWLQLRTGRAWRAWGDGRPEPGDLVFRGTADRLAGAWAGERCGLDVVDEARVAPLSDGWVDFGADPVVLGLYTVSDCRGLSAPGNSVNPVTLGDG
jgi:hypothetical protein